MDTIEKRSETTERSSESPAKGSRRSASTVVWGAVAVAIIGLVTYGLLSSGGGRPKRGDPAPPFSLTLWDGSRISLRDLRGQIVVLNFWASWCIPCRNEAPALQQVWEQYQDRGVVLVGVTYRDAKGASQAFVREFGITYGNGVDERGQISDAYGVTAVPETYVIDREGNVAWFQIGEIRAEELAKQLDQLQSK